MEELVTELKEDRTDLLTFCHEEKSPDLGQGKHMGKNSTKAFFGRIDG